MTDVTISSRQVDYPRVVTGILGPVVFFLMLLFVPQYAALGVLFWLASYWAVGVVPVLYTAFIPIIGFSLLGVDLWTILKSFVHPALILIVAPTLVIVAAIHCGLVQRMASYFMVRIGSSVRRQVLFWLVFATLLSDFAADTVIALALIPIVVKILGRAGYDTPEKIAASRSAMLLVIATSIGAGLGGILTPMAGGQAAITWSGLNAVLGGEVTAWSYTIRYLLPTTVCLGIVCGVFALLSPNERFSNLLVLGDIVRQPWSRHEKVVVVLFILAIGLPYVRPWLPLSLPWIYGILMMAVLCLWIPKVGMVLPVRELTKFPLNAISVWPIAMCVSQLIVITGVGKQILLLTGDFWNYDPLVAVGIWTLICLGLAQLASDTAAAGILIPIIQNVPNPVPWIMMTGFSVDLSFMVPTATGTIGVLYALGGRGHWRLPLYGAACAVACGLFSWLFWSWAIHQPFWQTLTVVR